MSPTDYTQTWNTSSTFSIETPKNLPETSKIPTSVAVISNTAFLNLVIKYKKCKWKAFYIANTCAIYILVAGQAFYLQNNSFFMQLLCSVFDGLLLEFSCYTSWCPPNSSLTVYKLVRVASVSIDCSCSLAFCHYTYTYMYLPSSLG